MTNAGSNPSRACAGPHHRLRTHRKRHNSHNQYALLKIHAKMGATAELKALQNRKSWHHGDPHSKYRFLRVLGTGHFGTTFLCSGLKSGELVAIKALDKHHPEYERELALQEITILATLCDLPYIVTLYEVWEDGNYIYLVMEACLGGELFDLILERGHFTERDAAQIVSVMLRVIQHCHLHGVIHRDLKPENFLLKRQESGLSISNLRAIDFGLSKFLPPGGSCASCVGSSYYVAPEVLRGCYSWEADVWSIGVITYILLSGFPPFWGSSDYMIFQRILENEVDFDYQPWQQISEPAKNFVGRLLEKDPSQRMTLPQALAHPWVTDHSAVPNVPLDPTIFGRLQAFTQQNRVKCLLMTVAARHLSDTAIGNLKEVFAYVDRDHDGMIDMADLSAALANAGIDLEGQGVKYLLEGLDLAHHGKVHLDEFIAAALDQKKIMTSKTISTIFAQLDHDKDGYLHVEQLSRALADCKVSIGADTLERLIEREGALDEAGMISAKSFHNLLLSSSADPMQLETYLQDVQRFSAANHFKQLAMLVIARHMAPEEVEGLRQLFHRLDEDGSGTINGVQLKEALAHMGKSIGEAELQSLLETLDLKQDGVIEYDEFLAAALEEQQLVTEAKMRAAFDYFDKTKEGFITMDDLVQVLDELGMDPGGTPAVGGAGRTSPTAASLAAAPFSAADLMNLADADHDAKITYADFKRMLLAQPDGSTLTRAPSARLKTTRSASAAGSCHLARQTSSVLGRQPSNLVGLVEMIEDAWMTSPKKIIPLNGRSQGLRISTPRSSPRTSLDSPGRQAAIVAAIAATSPRHGSVGSGGGGSLGGSPLLPGLGSLYSASPPAHPAGPAGSPFITAGSGSLAGGEGMGAQISLQRYGTAPGAVSAAQELAASASPSGRQQPDQQQQQQQAAAGASAGGTAAPAFCPVPTFMLDVHPKEHDALRGGTTAAAALQASGGSRGGFGSTQLLSGGFGSNLDLHSQEGSQGANGGSASLFGPRTSGPSFGPGGWASPFAGSDFGGGSQLYLGGQQQAYKGMPHHAYGAGAVAGGVGDSKPGLLTPGFLTSGASGWSPRGHGNRTSSGITHLSIDSTGSDAACLGGD